MNQDSRSNQQKAPQCAAFVNAYREVFGDVKVMHVKEGEFELGDPEFEPGRK